WEGILPAAQHLAGLKVDAIMVIGTSLTFYRGADAHDELMAKLRATTGLPVSTMSQAVVDGLMSFGARRIAVATAYADEVNNRLQAFLVAKGFEVLALEVSVCSASASPTARTKRTSSRSAPKSAWRRRRRRGY